MKNDVTKDRYQPITVTGINPPVKVPIEREWDRVQRMRVEGHYLIEGGQSQKNRGLKKNVPSLTFNNAKGIPKPNRKI